MMNQLVFVYNADGGKWNAAKDTLHKMFSPKTYPCSLCAITYGYFSIEPLWAEFIESLPIAPLFLHKDEWKQQFPGNDNALPAVFIILNNKPTEIISATQLNEMQLPDLIERVKSLKL